MVSLFTSGKHSSHYITFFEKLVGIQWDSVDLVAFTALNSAYLALVKELWIFATAFGKQTLQTKAHINTFRLLETPRLWGDRFKSFTL